MQSGMSQSQASFDPAMVERQRYMTQMQRRSMPPRCHPLSIVAMVLCLGMVFLGDNPLKKVGPALLGIGGCFFIAGLIGICWWQTNKKEAWQQSMQQLAQSRSAMQNYYMRSQYQNDDEEDDNQLYHGQSMDVKPGPGILKTPSISTYGKGSEYGDDYNNYPYNQGGYNQDGYDQQYGDQGGFKPPPGYNDVDQKGYPTATTQNTVDYDQAVPVPVRETTKKKPRPSQDETSPDKAEESRQMKSYPSQEGFDMYPSQQQEEPKRKPRKKKEGSKSRHQQPALEQSKSRDSSHSNDAYEHDQHTGYYANVPGDAGSPAQSQYSDQYGASPLVGAGAGMGLAGMGGLGIPGASMEQQLKINIRAQPNTAVHITPGGYHTTPPQPQHQPYNRQLNMSQSSVETEI